MAFTMDIEPLEKEQVLAPVAPPKEELDQVGRQAQENVKELLDVDISSMESRKSIVDSIESFGKAPLQRAEGQNRILEERLATLGRTGGESGMVVKCLADLGTQMKELDPSGIDFTKSGPMAKLFSPIKAYFQKYERADKVIDDIIKQLEKGRKILQNDNTTLEIEQQSLRDQSVLIEKQITLGSRMDAELEQKILEARAAGRDEDQVRFIEEEVLFPLRQRVMDLQQLLAVDQQGYFAMEVIRKNNKELIRAVERARSVTVQALRTAVIMAGALANQKLVLDSVNLLNNATNEMIKNTASMMKNQGAKIHQDAMSANISADTLKAAFADTFEALDAIDSYKQAALPVMKESITAFRELSMEAAKRMERMERGYDA